MQRIPLLREWARLGNRDLRKGKVWIIAKGVYVCVAVLLFIATILSGSSFYDVIVIVSLKGRLR